MKRIFITGISGFIGMHLALALKQRGDEVIGCDNFNSYYDVRLKHAREKILQAAGIPTLSCDIADKALIEKTLDAYGITHFVHLAAQAGVRYSLTHPDAYVHSNLHGFVQVLEALRSRPHIPLTYASSSSVYGLNTKIPFSETDPTDRAASFYGATKKSNELIAGAYHNIYGIPVTGLRFFTVYGPYGRPDMAYYSFTKAILEGTTIQVFGEGNLQRDFTYIEDIVEGTIAAIDLESSCEIFNLGNNRPHSVNHLIATLENLLGKKAQIQFSPAPAGDVPITYADISKSQKILSFSPRTPLEQGLQKFTDWYCNQSSF
ncbi:MAG: NAD-dependent epimerase/dehydratase family protein [Chlamydiota bacterium]